MTSPLKVGLIFHSAKSENLGVGALTVAEIEVLRRAGERLGRKVDVTVFDWRDNRPSYVPPEQARVVSLRMRQVYNPLGFWRMVRGQDAIVDIGAGDSFADIYGPERLKRLFAMKQVVHLARRPLVVAPQTIGPFTDPASSRRATATLRRSAIVATRDEKSTRAAHDLDPALKVIEASDVALRLPFTPPAPKAPDARPKVGLNVSGLLMSGGYNRKNMFGLSLDYPGLIRELIRRLVDHPSAPEVHLVPHVILHKRGGLEDDMQPSLDLAEEFKAQGHPVTVAPAFASPSEAKSYIAGMDFFAGARMHACIAAFSSGVPVVPMAYSRKFEGLFGSLGYGYTVDCTSDDADTILTRVMDGYERRTELETDRAAALARGLEKLDRYEDALVELFTGLS